MIRTVTDIATDQVSGTFEHDAPSADDVAVVEAAVAAIARGEMVVVVDDDDRENEGDLVVAASAATPEVLNFMVTHGRGLVCAPMSSARLDELGLPDMVDKGNDPLGTRFTVAVDLDIPGSTGISATARSETIMALADPATTSSQLRVPGHVFPLRYTEGGVLVRRGHTEASVDLARLAGREPAAAICEILAEDGSMLRGEGVTRFAEQHGLIVLSIEKLARYRAAQEHEQAHEVADVVQLPERPFTTIRVVETVLPTATGRWRTLGYADPARQAEHVALVLGDLTSVEAPLVRVHSECLTGDVLGSQRCDCGQQLELSFQAISREGTGVIVYIGGHEGRGIGLLNKLRAYALQDQGRDTVDANLELGLPEDARTFDQAADILADLGLERVRLLTNNPDKVADLRERGIDVVEAVPLRVPVTVHSAAYLLTKQNRLGHHLLVQPDGATG